MKEINYIDLFNRHNEKKQLLEFISNFSIADNTQTKGLYIVGPPGSGKTKFVESCISNADYDILYYGANNVRNKNEIPELIGNKCSNFNVLDMFSKKKKQIIIVMDEMDYMNSGDKGGIKEFIKYIRPKKTAKQRKEPQTTIPIIFIGTNDNDKKLKELINTCKLIQFTRPTNDQICNYIKKRTPLITNDNDVKNIMNYLNGNLHKLSQFAKFHDDAPEKLPLILKSLTSKYNHQSHSKNIIKNLYKSYIPISQYSSLIKETDRTTLGLLWHENLNVILNDPTYLGLYKEILNNLCIADYNDRIIFQNQVWQLSEHNSLIKTFYNNYILHENKSDIKVPDEIIFTKVLTKYSTEYSNYCFLQQLEQKIFTDKASILRLFNEKTDEELMNKYFITPLDIDRMNRFVKNSTLTFC